MTALFAPRIRAARRLAGICAIGLCAFAASAGPASAGADASHAKAGKTITLRFYSEVVSLTVTHADGSVEQSPTKAPAAGDQLAITELAYKGTHKRHARKFSASTYTLCIFKTANAAPTCDGATAIGGNQLLLFHTPSDGPPAVSGGTGRYAGATGTATSTEIGGTNHSDVVITVNLRK